MSLVPFCSRIFEDRMYTHCRTESRHEGNFFSRITVGITIPAFVVVCFLLVILSTYRRVCKCRNRTPSTQPSPIPSIQILPNPPADPTIDIDDSTLTPMPPVTSTPLHDFIPAVNPPPSSSSEVQFHPRHLQQNESSLEGTFLSTDASNAEFLPASPRGFRAAVRRILSYS